MVDKTRFIFGLPRWPSKSMKNRYDQSPVPEGLVSIRERPIFKSLKGSNISYKAPGLFFTATNIDVLSLPETSDNYLPITKNRVLFEGLSSILDASTDKPYRWAANSPPTAAKSSSSEANLAASALLATPRLGTCRN